MKRILFPALAALLLGAWSADAQIITGSSYSSETEYASHQSNSRYQGELNIGYGLGGTIKYEGDKEDAKFSRPMIETIHGMRINQYLFAGVGAGFQYAIDEAWELGIVPAFIDLKGYYPVTDKFAPYVAVDLGYGIGVVGTDIGEYTTLNGGFYASYGIGLNYGKLNFGIGWQHQSLTRKYDYRGDSEEITAGVNSFFVKIGLKF